jgi:LPLT family lysophospholipid transporter-like MFS transporter
MNRNLYILLLAQFLSAFADNAILFTVIAMVMQTTTTAAWYIPALQASFLIAFVLLAPWVGPFADARPKATVLITANVVKAIGAGLLLINLEPLLAYAVIGAGAAMYSPAKYGILPELVAREKLVKANGWIEGSTIVAILAGSLVGAQVADYSVSWAMVMVLVLYGMSAFCALFITRMPAQLRVKTAALPHFTSVTRALFGNIQARFSLLGTSLFWATAAVLRLMLVVWAPLVLLTTNTSQIAELTLYIAIGIAIGALLAPRLIPLEQLRRTGMAAFLIGVCILLLSSTEALWPARLALLAIGIAGGLFVVPMNAILQAVGHRTVGSGGAVAVQNFSENLSMLAATGIYTLAAAQGASAVASIVTLGIVVLAASVIVSRRLPRAGTN